MTVDEALLRHLYQYDRAIPLLPTSEVEPVADPRTGQPRTDLRRERVTFGSTHDRRVLATITAPAGPGPFPAVIAQPGSNPLGRHAMATARPDMPEPLAYQWALAGMVVVNVDIEGFGSREGADNRGRLTPTRPDLLFRTRDQRIQAVQDLMRTVDYLATRPDVRADAIGYHGVSMGCRIGVPFIALDHRVRAASLFDGGTGPYSRFVTEGTPFADLAADEALVAVLTDPAAFAPLTSHVPKFVANAEDDAVVSREGCERLREAFAEPKTLRWFAGTHAQAPAEVIEEARAFLATHLA